MMKTIAVAVVLIAVASFFEQDRMRGARRAGGAGSGGRPTLISRSSRFPADIDGTSIKGWEGDRLMKAATGDRGKHAAKREGENVLICVVAKPGIRVSAVA